MSSNTNKDANKGHEKATPTKAPPTTPNHDPPSDEKRYCICAQKASGTMIACDNDGCKIEWFHLPCVYLDSLPNKKAKWYCPSCRVELGKGVFSYGIVGGNF